MPPTWPNKDSSNRRSDDTWQTNEKCSADIGTSTACSKSDAGADQQCFERAYGDWFHLGHTFQRTLKAPASLKRVMRTPMNGSRRKREPLELDLKYRKVRDVNAGSFGFVQEAKSLKTGERVAVKFIPRGQIVTKYVAREIMNHSILLHPHIVQFKEVFLTVDYLAIVMEYVDGGDMFAYVKRRAGLEEDEARWYFQQLIMALQYSHEIGVINRDLKLENTLLTRCKRPLAKICDFGYSKSDTDSLPKSKVGTPGYTAPEVMFNSRSYNGQKADVWSTGVMLYVMLFCAYPFGLPDNPNSHPEVLAECCERARTGQCSFLPTIAISAEARDLMQRMLDPDPARRASVGEVIAHPWVQQDLPPGVAGMNARCLRLRGHTAGHQSATEIERIVQQAMGVPQCDLLAEAALMRDLESREEMW